LHMATGNGHLGMFTQSRWFRVSCEL
jgi:hypothetical protein